MQKVIKYISTLFSKKKKKRLFFFFEVEIDWIFFHYIEDNLPGYRGKMWNKLIENTISNLGNPGRFFITIYKDEINNDKEK